MAYPVSSYNFGNHFFNSTILDFGPLQPIRDTCSRLESPLLDISPYVCEGTMYPHILDSSVISLDVTSAPTTSQDHDLELGPPWKFQHLPLALIFAFYPSEMNIYHATYSVPTTVSWDLILRGSYQLPQSILLYPRLFTNPNVADYTNLTREFHFGPEFFATMGDRIAAYSGEPRVKLAVFSVSIQGPDVSTTGALPFYRSSLTYNLNRGG